MRAADTSAQITFSVGDSSTTPQSAQAAQPPQQPVVSAGGTVRLSGKERLALLDQLAILLDAGIQIPTALQSMRVECHQPRVLAALQILEQRVLAGLTLSDAMADAPKAFPDVLRQMVRAGESSGRMAEVLRRTVDMLEADAALRSKLRSAMMYPSVMAVLTVSVVVFLLTAIVPKFERMFRSKEAALPTPTRILLAVGDATTTYGIWVALGLVLAAVGLFLYARTTAGIRVVDAFVLKLPLVGAVYRTAVLARSARTLGLLVQSGVPAHVALEHTRDVASSPTYRDFWGNARAHVMGGGTLTDAVRNTALIPHTFQQVVAAGESTARLDTTMLKTADQYTRDLERRIRDLITLIEPAMVVTMGFAVGFIALSIMLPIFQLSRV